MRAMPYQLNGLFLFEPDLHSDERGAFFESFNALEFLETTGFPAYFAQNNQSISKAGVVRGLHFQLPPYAQGKLVGVVAGRIFDVAVDLRKTSASYGRWAGVELSGENNLQLWIPPGFAHGFLALEDETRVAYKVTDFWHRESERSIQWDDPQIDIDWPLNGLQPVVSEKDKGAPSFAECASTFGK